MIEQTRYTLHFATNDRAPFALWQETATSLFDSYTWYPVTGVWQGETEDSYKVEIISETDISVTVFTLARYIKAAYHQDCVLVTTEEIATALI